VISFQEPLHGHHATEVITAVHFSTIYQKITKLIGSFRCERHFGLLLSSYPKSVFLKLRSAKGCVSERRKCVMAEELYSPS